MLKLSFAGKVGRHGPSIVDRIYEFVVSLNNIFLMSTMALCCLAFTLESLFPALLFYALDEMQCHVYDLMRGSNIRQYVGVDLCHCWFGKC